MKMEKKAEIYEQLKTMAKFTGEPEINKDELFAFLDEPRLNDKEKTKINVINSNIAEKISQLMNKDLGGAEKLQEMLPQIKEFAKGPALEAASQFKSATDSFSAAKLNDEIHKAKEKLKEMTAPAAEAKTAAKTKAAPEAKAPAKPSGPSM